MGAAQPQPQPQPSPVPDHPEQHPACPATCTQMPHTDFYYSLKHHKSPRTPSFTAALWRGACPGSGLGALPKARGMSLVSPEGSPLAASPPAGAQSTTFREICLSSAGACCSTVRARGFPWVLQTNKRARQAELKGEHVLPTLPGRHRRVREKKRLRGFIRCAGGSSGGSTAHGHLTCFHS